jgi:hypothetical protein
MADGSDLLEKILTIATTLLLLVLREFQIVLLSKIQHLRLGCFLRYEKEPHNKRPSKE